MSIVIDGSLAGTGTNGAAGVTLRVYDFEFRLLGSVTAVEGPTSTYLSFIKFPNPYNQNHYIDPPDLSVIPGEIRLDFLFPVMPDNGIFVWMNSWANKVSDSSVSTKAEYLSTATLEVDPSPGVVVRLASGLTFTGGVELPSGDGVVDGQDSAPGMLRWQHHAATGPGTIEVDLDASSNGGMSFSQVQTFPVSDLSVNQTDRPASTSRTFPHGLVSFRVNGVQPGQTATVTLTFPEAILLARYTTRLMPMASMRFQEPSLKTGRLS